MTTEPNTDAMSTYQTRLEELLLRQQDRHRAARADAARECDRLRAELRAAEARVSELSDECGRMRQELDALYRSTSWRLTAPLRWMRIVLGRRR